VIGFVFFWKNMTFGYCFNPCVARLAIGWNRWSPTSYNFFYNDFFGYKLKGNGVYLGDLICLNVAILAINVKLFVRVLAIANSHKEKFRLLKHGE
jgi:hypothetical protein